MKQGNVNNWTNPEECINLLYTAQLIEELLDDYSILSNRVATLNSHFLCADALDAISSVELYGTPNGTIVPIMEELYEAVERDIVLSTDETKPEDCFVKMNNVDKPMRIYKLSELCVQDSKAICELLVHRYFRKNNYVARLMRNISGLVKTNDATDRWKIKKLVNSLLTELLDSGYSAKYIYTYNKDFFFGRNKVKSPDIIDRFFSAFKYKSHDYKVIFKVNKSIKKFCRVFNCKVKYKLKPYTDSLAEKRFIESKKDDQVFLVWEMKALEPYAAAEQARDNIQDNLSIYRVFDHTTVYDIFNAACYVYLDPKEVIAIPSLISSLQKVKIDPYSKINEYVGHILTALTDKDVIGDSSRRRFTFSLLNAMRYHSHSLDSSSEENKLLDLWAIIETTLVVKSSHSSERIKQICNNLVPILKRRYLFTLFDELAQDIETFNNEEYKGIVGDTSDRLVIARRVCEFCILPAFKIKRQEFAEKYSMFPLLIDRIYYYCDVLSTKDKVYQFVNNHTTRIQWQIMRIYRNRNKIIHNAQKMPYLELLVENLHTYVDELMLFLFSALREGKNLETARQHIFVEECEWLNVFTKGKEQLSCEMIQVMLKQ